MIQINLKKDNMWIFEDFKDINTKAMEKAIGEAVKDIYDKSQETVPVKTGKLKRSGDYSDIRVWFDTEYAGYVDKGTSRMEGTFFFTRAVEEVVARLAERLFQIILRKGE